MQWRIRDFNLEGGGVEFFLNFGDFFSHHSLVKRAKVHQWLKKPYGTLQALQNAAR